MCETRELVPIPDWAQWSLSQFDKSHPEYGFDEMDRRCFAIDACIVPALLAVWAAGFKTLGCCCGHGQGYGVVSLDMGLSEREDAAGVMARHHCSLCGDEHQRTRDIPTQMTGKATQ